MKRIVILCELAFVVLLLFGCGNQVNTSSTISESSTEPTSVYEEEVREYVSLLEDKTYKKGFIMRGLGRGIYNDDIENYTAYDAYDPNVWFDYEKGFTEEPYWHICQWATRYPFHDINNTTYEIKDGVQTFNYRFTDLGEGKYQYDNQSKKIVVDTNTGELEFGLKASECYKYDRLKGEEWPHLLLAADKVSKATNPTPQSSIKNSDSIIINLDCKLNSFVDNMEGPANPDIHSAVCMLYVYVSYKPDRSNIFTDMIWLGLTIFDNRFAFAPGMSGVDDPSTKASATSKWIYNIPTTHFFDMDNNLYDIDGNMKFNEWVNVNIDIYPYIESALIDAQRGGCMKGATLDNLYISGSYIGFELPGNYDIDMSFKNFDILSSIVVK